MNKYDTDETMDTCSSLCRLQTMEGSTLMQEEVVGEEVEERQDHMTTILVSWVQRAQHQFPSNWHFGH